MTTGYPPALTILYMYCTGGTECLSKIIVRVSGCPSLESRLSVQDFVSQHWQLNPGALGSIPDCLPSHFPLISLGTIEILISRALVGLRGDILLRSFLICPFVSACLPIWDYNIKKAT